MKNKTYGELILEKKNRQKKILQLIREKSIGTQEGLLEHLKRADIDATQATVSRDIKELNLTKIQMNNSFRYTKVVSHYSADVLAKQVKILKETVESVCSIRNMAILRCCEGSAGVACKAIDLMNSDDILGSLAGDDTIFVVFESDEGAVNFANNLRETIDEYSQKLI